MSEQPAGIRVEFYGIVRARAGVAEVVVQLPLAEPTLGDLLQHLAGRFTDLHDCCDGPRLRTGYTANIDGQQFATSPETAVRPGQVVLLMSADPGG